MFAIKMERTADLSEKVFVEFSCRESGRGGNTWQLQGRTQEMRTEKYQETDFNPEDVCLQWKVKKGC